VTLFLSKTARKAAREVDVMGLETYGAEAVEQETRATKRQLVARRAVRAVPLNIVNALFLSLLFIGHADPLLHGGWFALIVISALLRLGAMWRANQQKRAPTEGELNIYVGMSAVVGIGWGLTPFLLGPHAPGMVNAAVAMTIAGMSAGAAMTSASEHRVVLAYTIPALGLWAVSTILWGGWQGIVVAVMLLGFFAAMNALTRAYAGTLNEAVEASAALRESRRHTEAQAAAMSRLADHNDKAARRAEEQVRANAAVLANMSHELRTPLNGVLGMAQLLEESGLDKEKAGLVARVRASGEGLQKLLSDVMDVSRIEAGRLELALEDVTARTLAAQVRKAFASQAREKDVTFEVQVSGDTDTAVRADGQRLKQLASIFIGNAMRFTETGGVTAVFTTRSDSGGKSVLRLDVRDTGPGVPESAREHLFDALSADKMDRNIRSAGTGLGLHLAKRLVSLMDGEVGYRPAEDENGSVFWFEVRLKNSHKNDKYADGEQLTLDTRRLRMLIAESDPARRSVMLGYLKSFNCAVTSVPSRDELVESLGAAAYDAVILGLELSDGEPEDAVRPLRAMPSTAAVTPVVRLTTNLDTPVKAGFSEVLVRAPLAAEPLLEALHCALESDEAAVASLRRIA
jgi:signal transduction histidine kinase